MRRLQRSGSTDTKGIRQMSDIGSTARGAGEEMARETERHLGEAARAAKEAIDKVFGSAKIAGRRTAETVEHTVEAHPFYSMLAAFLAGLLIGALISRR
jgi:ElaB/YqjD/DUF883 family membrane-anchored ribosome-binding protein